MQNPVNFFRIGGISGKFFNLRFMNKFIISVIFLTFLLFSCARRGMPTGGDKDTTPPEVISENPPSGTISFQSRKISIRFNEFVVLDNPIQKIVISPPLNKSPKIFPMGYPSKKIEIEFQEKLNPRTTYTIYFNDAIKDYHEGNLLKNYKYVFSTGSQIDTIRIKGIVRPSYEFDLPEDIIVALYPAESFSDSLVFFGKPYYLSHVTSDGTFSLENLSPGEYYAIAFSDINHSLNYQPGEEQVAFLNEPVRLPSGSEINLILFKEKPPVRIEDITQKSLHKWSVKINEPYDRLKIQVPGKETFVYSFDKTVEIWVKPLQAGDTLRFKVYQDTVKKFEAVRVVGKMKRDSLQFRFSTAKLYPQDTLYLYSTVPVVQFNADLLKISPPVQFKSFIDSKGSLGFVFDPEQAGKKILLKIPPGTITDFLGNRNRDTLTHEFSVVRKNQTGNISIELEKTPELPLVVQLVDERSGKIVREKKWPESFPVSFEYLKPGKYKLRIILDRNRNGKWDTGNFKKRLQPEKVFLYPKSLEIRPNWYLKEKIQLPLD